MNIEFVKLHPEAIIPRRGTALSAGFDLVAREGGSLWSLGRKLVPTGVAVRLPPGHFAMVCPRSGLALKAGITVLNAPGIIDEDYRGEIGVVLVNLSAFGVEWRAGDRIAQLVVAKGVYPGAVEIPADQLDTTERGEGGFGSTGA